MTIWNIEELEEVTSTNTLAKQRFVSGELHHGYVLQAHHQTAGRGRALGRTWQDEPGQSLLMSLVIERVPVRPECMQYLTALSVLSSLRGLMEQSGVDRSDIFLKWPNDILIGGKKVCGILAEAIWQGEAMRGAILGIGVNVAQRLFTGAIQHTSVSLRQTGMEIVVNELRDTILHRIADDLQRYESMGVIEAQTMLISTLRKELGWMSGTPAMMVAIDDRPVLHDMKYTGVGDAGELLLQQRGGTALTLHSGSIEWEEPVRGIEVTTPRERQKVFN